MTQKTWDGRAGNLDFNASTPTIIAGPCMFETYELGFEVASFLKDVCAREKLNYVFKSSYDKANRTSKNAARGPGLSEGLARLSRIKDELKVPVLTDVHTPDEATAAGEVCDIIQIPAFLCEQRSLLLAAARTNKVIQIKKGQHTNFEQIVASGQFLRDAGNPRVLLCERGSSFGYHNLVVDYRNLIDWRRAGFHIVFDGTHAAQLPGAGAGHSSGIRYVVAGLTRGAVACGVDGVFLEVHKNPDKALSDAATQLGLDAAAELIGTIAKVARALR